MTRVIDQDQIEQKIVAIIDLSRSELIARWMKVYGRRPPKGISRRLLEYSAAYSIQVKALGGLKLSVRRKLNKSGGEGKIKGSAKESSSNKKKLSSGARLVRDWHGQTHTIDVVEDGFRYDGQNYRSLSQIAREITGARWSGPRFFGL